jgi:hypothetical protein
VSCIVADAVLLSNRTGQILGNVCFRTVISLIRGTSFLADLSLPSRAAASMSTLDPKLTLMDVRLLEVRITLLQDRSNDCERAEPCHLKASFGASMATTVAKASAIMDAGYPSLSSTRMAFRWVLAPECSSWSKNPSTAGFS